MQRSNLKLVEHRKKPNGSSSSEWLDAWVWAERISVIGLASSWHRPSRQVPSQQLPLRVSFSRDTHGKK